MKDEDYSWAAGIIEGEGCIIFNRIKNRKASHRVGITVTMTDEDVVRKLHTILGVGTVCGPYDRGTDRKPVYSWSVQNQKGCFDTLLRVGQYLGQRRTKKAAEMFEFLEERLCK